MQNVLVSIIMGVYNEEKTLERKLIAFPELGMEALYLLKVDKYPAIIAAAHGRSIYE